MVGVQKCKLVTDLGRPGSNVCVRDLEFCKSGICLIGEDKSGRVQEARELEGHDLPMRLGAAGFWRPSGHVIDRGFPQCQSRSCGCFGLEINFAFDAKVINTELAVQDTVESTVMAHSWFLVNTCDLIEDDSGDGQSQCVESDMECEGSQCNETKWVAVTMSARE